MFSLLNRFIFFLFFIVCIADSNQTQAIPLDNLTGTADSIICKNPITGFFSAITVTSDSTAVIPFTRAGNLILVSAKADTMMGNFILDTGAPNLVLNITYFRNYSMTTHPDEEQAGISGPAGARVQAEIAEFSIGNIKYDHVEADMVNLGHIENSKGVKILGLLGLQLFRGFEMIIDYEKNIIYLHLVTKKESRLYKSELLSDTSAYTTVPFDITDNKIITRLEIAGKKLRFIIDCGAETNMLDSRLPDKIFENVIINRRVNLIGANNKKVEALYGGLNNMKIGTESISNLPVLITNLEKSCLSYISCTDGILGFDFLSLHKIGFNFVTRKMYIWKQ